MAKQLGFILYEGPSALDGAPIVVVATTGKTRNEKTGDMVQTWIMRQDIAPHQAIKTGDDASVCGNCPHRGQGNGLGRSCYVTVFQAPLAVWKAYKRGAYPALAQADYAEAFKGRKVRMGAYGDPMAAPASIWQGIADAAQAWTGYTHQHSNAALPTYQLETMRGLVMASCDTEAQALAVQHKGWRTFRTMTPDEHVTAWERLCLAEARGLSCADCRACAGESKALPSIAIHVHGSGASNYATNCRA